MFSNDDITRISKSDLSSREPLELAPGDMQGSWERLENLRLEKDGPYPYWKLRGGLTSVNDFGATILDTYGFEARVDATVEDYLAVYLDNGTVNIFNRNTNSIDHSLSGFSGSVQFYSAGKFLYVFNESNSKYIDLGDGTVSGYLSTGSAPIKSSTGLSSQDLDTQFPLRIGESAIVFPPKLKEFSVSELIYKVTYVNSNTGDTRVIELGEFTETELNNKTFDQSQLDLGPHFISVGLNPGTIYRYKEGQAVNIDEGTLQDIEYVSKDSNGYIYFSTNSKAYITYQLNDNDITMPDIKALGSGEINADNDFTKVRFATITNNDGSLYASIDGGRTILVSDPKWRVSGYDKSLESFIGQSGYNTVGTTIDTNTADLSTDKDSGEVSFTSYDYVGVFPDESSTEDGNKYFKQYIIVDVLDDGSVCIPGKPIIAKRDPSSDIVGSKLEVGSPASNVAKRYLCASRLSLDKDLVFRPSSSEYPNGPLFIVREVEPTKTSIADFTTNKDLRRPITEVLPLSAGVPVTFGKGQVVPKNICSFESTIAIGGYTINRPTASIYTSYTNSGNIYLDRTDAATSSPTKTVTVFFEYTDGSYSKKDSATLCDGDNTITIHSLNSLVSMVHIYVSDGSQEYKYEAVGSTDAEFGGLPLKIETDFTSLDAEAMPDSSNEQESINLENYVTVPIPIQNIQISSQAKVFGNDAIVGMVPLDYDPDRSPLRYRLQVFTTDNIQVGYITEVQQGSTVTYNSNFEIAVSSRRAKSRDSIHRIDGAVFFQDDQGINIISGQSSELVIDSKEYAVATNDVTDVVFNEQDGEIWFLFDNNDVLVFDTKSQVTRTFSFPVGTMRSACYEGNTLFASIGSTLCEAESGSSDLGSAITGQATTQYLGGNRTYTEINQVHVVGHNGQVQLKVDDQQGREPYSSSFNGFDFSPALTSGWKSVTGNGTLFAPRKRGIKPRVQLAFQGSDTTVEEILIDIVPTERRM